MATPLPRVRRIVTGFDAQRESTVISDSLIEPQAPPAGSHETQFCPIWGTTSPALTVPFAQDGVEQLTEKIVNPKGSTFRVVDTGPRSSSPMHNTLSLDYIIMLAGSIEMEVEGGETLKLKAGDIVVQQGAVHQWHNRTDEWARFATVMLGAEIQGGPKTQEHLLY